MAGYNVQIAVDAQHKLIVASEVVNDGNDTAQLHALALAAKAAVGAETLRACEADGIEAFVAEPERGWRPVGADRFDLAVFSYDGEADVYRCPRDSLLRPMRGYKQTGRHRRYRAVSGG